MKTKLPTEGVWKANRVDENRMRETIEFIKWYDFTGRTADCGEANLLKQRIEFRFGCKIDSLDWDFNKTIGKSATYDTILAFEVLEHIYNPLLFLNQLKGLLKQGGVIYLSTPYHWPQFLKGRYHYHEIPTDRLMWLFEEAGLEIVRQGKVTIAGSLFDHLKGIRPFLRYFQKTRIYKLKVK